MSARILVIDDDERIARLLHRILRIEGHQVSEARDGREGLELTRRIDPDLIIMDIMMPGPDGIEVCRELRSWNHAPVMMLTALAGEDHEVRALEAGADDFMTKPFAATVLLAHVHALLRRAVLHPELRIDRPRILNYDGLSLHTGTRVAAYSGKNVELGATEFRLLSLFLEHPEQILSHEQIHRAVWGQDFSCTSNVLAVQVSALRGKLELLGCPPLIHTSRGSGYMLQG